MDASESTAVETKARQLLFRAQNDSRMHNLGVKHTWFAIGDQDVAFECSGPMGAHVIPIEKHKLLGSDVEELVSWLIDQLETEIDSRRRS